MVRAHQGMAVNATPAPHVPVLNPGASCPRCVHATTCRYWGSEGFSRRLLFGFLGVTDAALAEVCRFWVPREVTDG